MMQVQNVKNSNMTPAFKGKVDIIPGDLSYKPAKYVRKAYNTIENIVKDKPYNLYIRQNHKEDTVSVIAQKESDFIKNRGLRVEYAASSSLDVYGKLAALAADTYDLMANAQSKSLKQRFKNIFMKQGFKFTIKKGQK